jgi:hypothetical protein
MGRGEASWKKLLPSPYPTPFQEPPTKNILSANIDFCVEI